MSRRELERRSKVSARSISRIETGEYTEESILPRTIQRLADALGVTIEELKTDWTNMATAHLLVQMDEASRQLCLRVLALPPARQKAIMTLIESLYNQQMAEDLAAQDRAEREGEDDNPEDEADADEPGEAEVPQPEADQADPTDLPPKKPASGGGPFRRDIDDKELLI